MYVRMYICMTLLQQHHHQQHIQIIKENKMNKELHHELQIEASEKLLNEKPAFTKSIVDL